MPEISIIIPVYNSSRFLAKCLESVGAQTVRDIEIICVNDGSTDNSLMILQQYQLRDRRFIIIDQTNKGVSSARNAGIARASGNYLYFLDGDDLLSADSLSLIIHSKHYGNYDVILGEFHYLFSNSASLHVRNKKQIYFNKMKEKLLIDYVTWDLKIIMGSFIVNHELVKKSNLKFNEGQSYAEDVEFIIKMLYFSNSACVLNKNINIYRIQSTSAIGKINLKRFDSYFSRKRLLNFFSNETEFTELVEIYRGYLIPEAIITIINLWARNGKDLVVLKNFLRDYNVLDDLYLVLYDKQMPATWINDIKKYKSSPSLYFCSKRLNEFKYNIKAFAYQKLKY